MDLWVTEDYKGSGSRFKVTQTLHHSVSSFQEIDVVETESYGKMLLLDGTVMTTERDEFIYHEMITHIPLLAHPNPSQILIIGGGDGGTVREVLKHPSIERVVLCEIDGEVLRVSKEYFPHLTRGLADPRVEVCVQDGVQYIQQHTGTFDVILIDSTDADLEGPGQVLFTTDFYQQVAQALTLDGILTAQTESPLSNPDTFKQIYTRLLGVFPVALPYLATIPTYPGGLWSWSFCSKAGKGPFSCLSDEKAYEIEQGTQYYNRQIHRACFSMPNFIRNMMLEPVSP